MKWKVPVTTINPAAILIDITTLIIRRYITLVIEQINERQRRNTIKRMRQRVCLDFTKLENVNIQVNRRMSDILVLLATITLLDDLWKLAIRRQGGCRKRK